MANAGVTEEELRKGGAGEPRKSFARVWRDAGRERRWPGIPAGASALAAAAAVLIGIAINLDPPMGTVGLKDRSPAARAEVQASPSSGMTEAVAHPGAPEEAPPPVDPPGGSTGDSPRPPHRDAVTAHQERARVASSPVAPPDDLQAASGPPSLVTSGTRAVNSEPVRSDLPLRLVLLHEGRQIAPAEALTGDIVQFQLGLSSTATVCVLTQAGPSEVWSGVPSDAGYIGAQYRLDARGSYTFGLAARRGDCDSMASTVTVEVQ